MALGGNAVKTFRDIMMYKGLEKFCTDETQSPHLTYMRKLKLSDDEKASLSKMMRDEKSGRITLDVLMLRKRKTDESFLG